MLPRGGNAGGDQASKVPVLPLVLGIDCEIKGSREWGRNLMLSQLRGEWNEEHAGPGCLLGADGLPGVW